MKIKHQSFGGRCLFCGVRTQDAYVLMTKPDEILPDVLWRPGPCHGDALAKGATEVLLPPGSSPQTSAKAFQKKEDVPPALGQHTRPVFWNPANGPMVEDLYDDCPNARFFTLLFFALFILPMTFFIFGWQLLLVGTGLGGLFFKFFLTTENEKWYGLRDVQDEYGSLLATAGSHNRNYCNLLLGSALSSLFSLRDRAFKARSLILGESVEEIDYKIQCIENRARNIDDVDLSTMYRSQLKDLRENRKKIKQISALLEKFEASKNCMVESIKLLKNRILLTETNGDKAEEAKIREDLRSLHFVYERVNNPFPNSEPDPDGNRMFESEASFAADSPAQIRKIRTS